MISLPVLHVVLVLAEEDNAVAAAHDQGLVKYQHHVAEIWREDLFLLIKLVHWRMDLVQLDRRKYTVALPIKGVNLVVLLREERVHWEIQLRRLVKLAAGAPNLLLLFYIVQHADVSAEGPIKALDEQVAVVILRVRNEAASDHRVVEADDWLGVVVQDTAQFVHVLVDAESLVHDAHIVDPDPHLAVVCVRHSDAVAAHALLHFVHHDMAVLVVYRVRPVDRVIAHLVTVDATARQEAVGEQAEDVALVDVDHDLDDIQTHG